MQIFNRLAAYFDLGLGKRMPEYLNKVPILSTGAIRSLSSHRRASLAQEIKNGKFGESNAEAHGFRLNDGAKNPLGLAVVASSNSNTSQSTSSSWRGSGDTSVVGPDIYSPLWLTGNLSLPRDRATVNAWSRAFFALNPIVQNAISLHSTYPISRLNIRCKDPKVEQFFEEMNEELDLINVCANIAQEYWILGECFPYANLDQSTGKWANIVIHNPDYINVVPGLTPNEPQISLRPDEQIKKVVNSPRPGDKAIRDKMPRDVVESIKKGQNIVLSNFNVTHLARRISPYELRGTGLITPCFRALMHFDIIREAELVQNQALINPWMLITVGGSGTEYKPDAAALQSFREKIEQATFNKDFKLITHDQVKIENISRSAGILDTTNRIQQLLKEIYIGLMVPQVLFDSGEISYANGSVNLDVLKQRYLQFRIKLAKFLQKKIFEPIADLHKMYTYEGGEKKLIVPTVEWNYMSMFDVDSHIDKLKELSNPDRKQVSLHTLYKSLGLDFEEEQNKLREEAVAEAILKKEAESLSHLSLAELRTLGPTDEIPEADKTMGETDTAKIPGTELANNDEIPEGLPGVPPPPAA